MSVTLRRRQKSPKGKISLYLDIIHKGKRWNKFLKMYLHPNPENGNLSPDLKAENKKTLSIAKLIRSKFEVKLHSGEYGISNESNTNASFLEYFQALADKRKNSFGNYGNWDSALKHIKKYSKGKDVSFGDISPKWVEGFKEYLDHDTKKKDGTSLTQNSKLSYFRKLKAALNQAVKDEIIIKNPALNIMGFKEGESQRAYLTFEELALLVKTPCELSFIKTSFLFSCLTGLRHSDIKGLTWNQIEYSKDQGNYIRFVQAKTKQAEKLYIQEQALRLLGPKGDPDKKIFPNMYYSAHFNEKLHNWVKSAGIKKHITFHCARHTYATLQIANNTNLYTVSKLLGHKSIKTTQIYAKIMDKEKRKAVDNMPDIGLDI
jgi:integrase